MSGRPWILTGENQIFITLLDCRSEEPLESEVVLGKSETHESRVYFLEFSPSKKANPDIVFSSAGVIIPLVE